MSRTEPEGLADHEDMEHHIEFHWVGCRLCGCWVALLQCCCGDSRTWHLPDVVCADKE